MSAHAAPHPHAGQRVTVASGFYAGTTREVVDWYDRVTGRPWSENGVEDARTHRFAFRAAYDRLPLDQEVVLVHFHRGEGALLHATELGEPAYALAPIGARS
ncbi:hypothetical protein ASF53_02170 [Methylobacterium sp. Leaf123]|uniref:hypothetical protein n=1 Tax=Methylobacterium sp. Leaf123 TaxID=1736264 RepID=UPI0006F68256|nr:hypothetical protein [Methylobacterium sp. Leaf123]KQQ31527.1 hypothetical protein ASF53_02170 [Methylobacterium sp. Leaf123]